MNSERRLGRDMSDMTIILSKVGPVRKSGSPGTPLAVGTVTARG